MVVFAQYLGAYLKKLRGYKWILTTALVAALVAINYLFHLERVLKGVSPWWGSLFLFFLFYSFVFLTAHWISSGSRLTRLNQRGLFFFLLFFSAFLFAGKVVNWNLAAILPGVAGDPWNHYWTIILQLPVKLLALLAALYFIGKLGNYIPPFFGLTSKHIRLWPYCQIIGLMVPVIALAALRPDFQHTYPRLQSIAPVSGWPFKLLFEISYGLDFVSIEFFFRGLLVLGMVRFVGEDAILPMAAFYCTVHFGKPLGECISSYFGGIFLGVVAYQTRSIAGGLLVHLGIAYLMEIAGWLTH